VAFFVNLPEIHVDADRNAVEIELRFEASDDTVFSSSRFFKAPLASNMPPYPPLIGIF
jgi:hypothetical protein